MSRAHLCFNRTQRDPDRALSTLLYLLTERALLSYSVTYTSVYAFTRVSDHVELGSKRFLDLPLVQSVPTDSSTDRYHL